MTDIDVEVILEANPDFNVNIGLEEPGVNVTVDVPSAGSVGTPGPPGPVDTTAQDMIITHQLDPTPHAVYDDMPSLSLIFDNHLI